MTANAMTHTHAWGPPLHYLRCRGGTLADQHIRICSDCYDVEPPVPCHCTPEQRQETAALQRVLGDPPQGWGAA